MLTGCRFLVAGLSHLTVRVAEALAQQHAEVVVIGEPDRDPSARDITSRLPDDARLVVAGRDRDDTLLDAGIIGATGFLAVGDDDLDNLRYAGDAHALAPEVPVVLRTFQPELADHLADSLNIRRAYSVAALAAPAFVAASFAEEVVTTLRLGDEEIPLCVLDINASSPLAGLPIDEVKAATQCAVVAVRVRQDWVPATDPAARIEAGARVLVGGRHADVLALAARNDPGVGAAPVSRRRRRSRGRAPRLTATLLPISAAVFAVVFVLTAIVNRVVFDLDATDAINVAVTTTLGGSGPPTQIEWVQLFNILAIVAGTVLLWVLLSHITAMVLAERFESRMTKRASRMRDHVVVVGLGKIGYRVVQVLDELGIPTVAIEHAPNSRFLDAVATHTPVISGDGQLAENLQRAAVERARCVIACTNDDLANLASCLEARNLNADIRTVTRVFDEQLASRLGDAFRVDVALSSTSIAASAFIGAATDVLAIRTIDLDGIDLLAFRFSPAVTVSVDELQGWRRDGLRVLAVQRGEGDVLAPTAALDAALERGDEAILVGPAALIRRIAGTDAAHGPRQPGQSSSPSASSATPRAHE